MVGSRAFDVGALEAAPSVDAAAAFLVERADEAYWVWELAIEASLQPALECRVVDLAPRFHRLPDEHERHLTGSRVIEPHFLGEEGDPIESVRECLTERPYLVVAREELVEVGRVDREHKHLDRAALMMCVVEAGVEGGVEAGVEGGVVDPVIDSVVRSDALDIGHRSFLADGHIQTSGPNRIV
jgi:hypothetical protein